MLACSETYNLVIHMNEAGVDCKYNSNGCFKGELCFLTYSSRHYDFRSAKQYGELSFGEIGGVGYVSEFDVGE